MSIISDFKEIVAKKTVSASKKVGNGIATVSSLSPKQISDMNEKRKQYLSVLPDMKGADAQAAIQKSLGAIGIEVYQAYLDQLKEIYVPIDSLAECFDADNRIRFFDITKWVTDSEEQSIDKLVNVYHVLSDENCNIALIYHRTKDKCTITLGIANTNEDESDPSIADKYFLRVKGAIKGNFPGSDIKEKDAEGKSYCGSGIPDALKGIIGNNNDETVKSIVTVSNVASEKSEGFISQSMEKLLDGIVPEDDSQDYTVVLLAKPVDKQLETKNRLYELYSALSPFSSWQESNQFTQTDMTGSAASAAANASIGVNFAVTGNFGLSFSRSSNTMKQVGENKGVTNTYTNYGVKHTLDVIEAQVKRIEESSALGMWEFASYIISDSPVIANNVAHMYLALTQGEESFISKAAVNCWDGEIDTNSAKIILSSVQKLQHPVFGLKASLEDEWLMYPTLVTATTLLSGKELAKALNFPRKSVSGLPVFEVVPFGREPHSLLEENMDIDIGCGYHMRKKIEQQRILISKEELTKHTFITGSTGSGKSNTIYTLLEKVGKEGVRFLVVEPAKGEYKDALGKIKGVVTYGTNPLIADTRLLRINPFRFPEHTHVLEHLDRLIEIFNVCWPMYAAMPAILKDAVERAYKRSGWDLEKSTNRYSQELFPTFNDVVKEIKQVLEESDYSDDNKGDYTGSLVTRLKSLTNGINGLIFSADDLNDEELFDCNAIIDLSRIGSTETKSLIMGLLVLKLQEHRMEQRSIGAIPNDSLKHVTVLEEAHNLLKRTSSVQSGEGSNLLGKSVEMLANSIAEMRTYGEGFIIADQSPGLLDMSVIRNTNTKIILRLPDFSDRDLVGKAAGLTDNQITELAKLEKGVAAISQSDWLEPVLCKVDLYTGKDVVFPKNKCNHKEEHIDNEAVEQSLLECIMTKEIYRKGDRVDIQTLKDIILQSRLDTIVKCDFLDYISAGDDKAIETLRALVYDFLDAEEAIKASKKCNDINEWVHSVADNLSPKISEYSRKQIDLVMALLVYEQSLRDASYNDIFCRFTEIYKMKGGVY